MNKILLVNPNSPDPPPLYFGPPYGLALIAAYLEKDGKTPVCLDFERETIEKMIDEVKRTMVKEKIKYVGISCQSSNRGYIYKLIREIRRFDKKAIIILGGPFSSQKYRLLLNNFPIDYIIIGDGEITFGELVDCLERGGHSKEVKGLAFLQNNKTVITEEREQVEDLDRHPFPAFHLFRVKERLKNNDDFALTESGRRKVKELRGKRCFSMSNALMLLSSIGCIYNCTFCPMSGVKKGKYREHSPKYFADMVEYFSKMYDQKFFVFGDNFFTKNIARTMEIVYQEES
jgi:anaerobic magnesium-protoporphyrin IX monomethyl ester cyclase